MPIVTIINSVTRLRGDFSASMNYFYLSGHMPRDYQSNFSRPHIMILTQDGQATLADETEVDGLPIQTPVLDIVTVGGGGGSIV